MSFRFEYSSYLWWLIVIVILAVLFYFVWTKLKTLNRFYLANLDRAKLFDQKRWIVKQSTFLLGLACCAFSLVNPQMGTETVTVMSKGADVYLALDISNSMYATDIQPSRMEKAKRISGEILSKLKGNRVGVISFAGGAYLQMPVSADLSSAQTIIAGANPTQAGNQGTAIGEAIELATKTFEENSGKNKAIIIITDGESHDEEASNKAKEAQKAGVTIIAIGIGKEGGANIMLPSGDIMYDNAGEKVVTKLNTDLINQLSEEHTFYINNSSSDPSSAIVDILAKLSGGPVKTDAYEQAKSLFQIPLALGLLLILVSLLIKDMKTIKPIENA
jgi:Ca-activated chloride channel homolog